jgi:hypothetical protein
MELSLTKICVIRSNSCNPLTLQKIKLLKTVFAVGNTDTDCDILLLEIGEGYCCQALLKGKERTFQQIKYTTFHSLEAEENLAAVFNELEKENYQQVIVCSALPQSLLIPNQFNSSSPAFLNAIYDDASQKIFTDSIPEWQTVTIYSIPASVFSLVIERFPSAQFLHAYTPVLKIYNGFTATDQIDIHFSTQHFRILVKKQNHIQLAQIYSYKTPLDVVYYLLKICYESGLNQSQIFLIVSGLIDKDSAMYAELHSYFLNLHFAQAPSYTVPGNEYPHHYFTSLYNLAACVS